MQNVDTAHRNRYPRGWWYRLSKGKQNKTIQVWISFNFLSQQQVDIDEHSELALDYDVASVPVLLVVRDGKVEKRLVGLQDTDKLRQWVQSAVK